jgi:hypothetical protein
VLAGIVSKTSYNHSSRVVSFPSFFVEVAMGEEKVEEVGQNSPEEIAYRLWAIIHHLESKKTPLDRKGILDLYAECLLAVKNPNSRVSGRRL